MSQTLVSNICKAAPMFFFWAHNGLNEFPEVHFEFPFNLISKWTMALSLTGQSRRVRKSWYTVGGQNKDSGAVPQTDLAKSFSPWRSPVIRGVLKALLYSQRLKMSLWKNRPFPSSKNPHFQNEAKCTTFLVKMSFICIRMKNHFHIKG